MAIARLSHIFSKPMPPVSYQRHHRLLITVGLSAALLTMTACQPSEPTSAKPNTKAASQPIPASANNHLTIYSSIDQKALQPLLDKFTQENDIAVTVVNDQPMSILARLKAEGAGSPADVILTEDVGVFQQAIEASLLQPFSSDKAVSNVPERYRDPTGHWLALSAYARTVVYDSRVMTENDISSYADLAKPKWYQKLCLSQGKYPPNQALTVNLMNNLGDKKTTEVLQGWVANLAMPPVLDDNALMQAIDNGKCQLALVNSHNYANYLQSHPQTPIKLAWVNKGYGGVHTNITGIAITHTTKHPEFALSFIEWLSGKEQQTLFSSLTKTFPINPQAEAVVLLKSWGDMEASPIAVAKYAEQQKATIDLMQKAGYY